MLETSIVGAILGLLGRLAPEIINFFKGKDENKHELEMLKVQTELEKMKFEAIKVQGDQRIEEKYVDYSTAEIQAIAEVAKADSQAAKYNYKWVNAAISLQRPYITFFMFNIYVVVKLVLLCYGIYLEDGMVTILSHVWTNEDAGLLSMIVSYLYLNRTLEKYRK